MEKTRHTLLWFSMFILTLWRYSWHKKFCEFKVYMFIWHTYILQNDFHHTIANTPTISHNFHYIFVVRIFKMQSLNNFQVHDIVLLAIITMYIRSPGLIHLKSESLYPWPVFPHFSHPKPLVTTNLLSVSIRSGWFLLHFVFRFHI